MTKTDALDLIQSSAWQAYVIDMMQLLTAAHRQAGTMVTEQLTGQIVAFRGAIEHPYRLAGRDSPLKALEELKWLKSWLEARSFVDPEEWRAFLAWKTEQSKAAPEEKGTDTDRWMRALESRRPSTPV